MCSPKKVLAIARDSLASPGFPKIRMLGNLVRLKAAMFAKLLDSLHPLCGARYEIDTTDSD